MIEQQYQPSFFAHQTRFLAEVLVDLERTRELLRICRERVTELEDTEAEDVSYDPSVLDQ